VLSGLFSRRCTGRAWGQIASATMTLPIFRADDDPGPSFVDVLRRAGRAPRWDELPATGAV
jgi:hypothetical protein